MTVLSQIFLKLSSKALMLACCLAFLLCIHTAHAQKVKKGSVVDRIRATQEKRGAERFDILSWVRANKARFLIKAGQMQWMTKGFWQTSLESSSAKGMYLATQEMVHTPEVGSKVKEIHPVTGITASLHF